MFSALHFFSRLGEIFDLLEGGPTPGGPFYVTEDGASFYVAEDGTDNYVPE